MTDEEAIDQVLSLFQVESGHWSMIERNGRILLALPPEKSGALRALTLYQPQRFKARAIISALRFALRMGVHHWLLPKVLCHGGRIAMEPALPEVIPYTTGVLLGSAEHRVQRAIVSYQNGRTWEVAKVSFGTVGAQMLHDEAAIIERLQSQTAGVPRLLGLHEGNGITVMRLPYLTGKPLAPSASSAALHLLYQWISRAPLQSIKEFPEWAAIQGALSDITHGEDAIEHLSHHHLRPVIRHGDFARWNLLKQADGTLVVLDWEWGHSDGMPGLDLVHYFLQDARLVERLHPAYAIRQTMKNLNSQSSRNYLENVGWGNDPLLPMIACLAWKQGARHQDNGDMLKEILR